MSRNTYNHLSMLMAILDENENLAIYHMTRFHQVEVSWIVSDKHLYFNWAWFFILGFLEIYSQPPMWTKFPNPSNQLIVYMNIKLASSWYSWFEVHKENSSHVCCLLWMINSVSIILFFHNKQPMYILKCFFSPKWLHKAQRSLVWNKLHLGLSCYHPFLIVMDEVISSSSFCSKMGYRFCPQIGLIAAATVCMGAVVLLHCVALLLASTAAGESGTVGVL